MRVYLDLVMGLNFLVDFLLILGTNRLAGHPLGWKRSAAGAGIGAGYSGACFLPGFHFLGNGLWRLIFLALMGAAAFGMDRSGWKRCGIFVLLSMALGGMALTLNGRGGAVALIAAVSIWGLCRMGLGGRCGGREFVPVEIAYGGRCLRLTALRDTGNGLQDPVTGESVLVIGPEAAANLLGLTQSQLQNPVETLKQRTVPGLRLIPYRSVGQPGGMLLGLRMKEVTVGDRRGSVLVAFAPARIGGNEGYQALTGGVL